MRKALLLFALVACAPKIQYPECKTDPDCAGHGQVCVSGFCKECREDADCAAAHPDRPVCRDALCTRKPECTRSEECAAGLKCAQEKCVPECAAAEDCGPGKKCVEGRCAAD